MINSCNHKWNVWVVVYGFSGNEERDNPCNEVNTNCKNATKPCNCVTKQV